MTVAAEPVSTGSHRTLGQLRSVMKSATAIHVTKDGNDTSGNGTQMFPYLTVTKAMTKVTSTRKIIRLSPGTYTEAAAIVWPTTVSGIQLIGVGNRWETVISNSATGTQVINVAPGLQTSTFELTIQGVQIAHSNGQNGLVLNNTSMEQNLNCYFGQVGMDGEGDDQSVLVVHGDTSNAVRIYWDGGNGEVAGSINLAIANDGDQFIVRNVDFAGDAIATGTNVAGTIEMLYCRIPYRSFTGGGATTVISLAWCTSDNAGTLAPCDDATVTTNSDNDGPVIVGT